MNSDTHTSTAGPFSNLWAHEDLMALVSRNGHPAETLSNIVNLVHRQFATDVCSVYVLEADRATLMLAATVGLRADSVGRIRMHTTEGLAGLVAEQLRPVVVHDTTTHPRFKYFRDAGEDPYRTFLGVPVMDRGVLQGVLVVQTAAPRHFGDDDVRSLTAAASQLAPFISEARAVGQFVAPVHQRLAALARNLWWSYDGARAQDRASDQCRLLPPRPCHARDVETAVSRHRRGARPDRPRHQRRPREHVAGAADAPRVLARRCCSRSPA